MGPGRGRGQAKPTAPGTQQQHATRCNPATSTTVVQHQAPPHQVQLSLLFQQHRQRHASVLNKLEESAVVGGCGRRSRRRGRAAAVGACRAVDVRPAQVSLPVPQGRRAAAGAHHGLTKHSDLGLGVCNNAQGRSRRHVAGLSRWQVCLLTKGCWCPRPTTSPRAPPCPVPAASEAAARLAATTHP